MLILKKFIDWIMEFDEILSIERNIYEEGKKKGEEEVKEKTYVEGYNFGIEHGKKYALEIGKISGIIEFYFQMTKDCTEKSYSENFYKTLKSLKKLISEFEFDATKDEMNQKYDSIQNKYKLLQLRLGLQSNLQNKTDELNF